MSSINPYRSRVVPNPLSTIKTETHNMDESMESYAIKEGPVPAKPAETSKSEKPSPNENSILKEALSVLKTVIEGLGAAIVGLTVGTVASTIAGAIRGSAEGSAAGAATGESYGGNVGRVIASFAGGVVGGIAGSLAGSVAIPVIAADTLARKAGSLSETKAPKEQADPATIGKHKASTESQLTVALENFKLAAAKVGIDSDRIDAKVTELKTTITANIETAYPDDCDSTSVDKQFRNKHDDFGLTAELATLLQPADAGELASKDAAKYAKSAKSAMSATKPTAIDTVGQNKAAAGFQGSIALDGEKRYTTEIKMQTTEFVSSASNKANGNTCGNLNLQTLTGEDGKVRFKTLRHAALTAKPDATETKDPFRKGESKETAATKAKTLCADLNSKDPATVQEATQELKKYGIKASDFKGLLSGRFDETKLAKKMAKQCGLLNKALDVGKAAWEAQGSPKGSVNITSLSLMTPDRPRAGLFGTGGEVGKLKDQAEAFKLLQSLRPQDLADMGIGSADTPVTFNVMTFNFGVNEGESLGRGLQKEYNEAAMGKLMTLSTSKLADLSNAIQKTTKGSPEFAKLFVQIETIQALGKDIGELHTAYKAPPSDLSKGLWRADQAYNLTAKISFLTELCDGVNTCNCASGKDRTGMHVNNSLNYAGLMRDRMDGRMGDLKYEQMSEPEKIKHLDAHHFDVLEAAAEEVKTTEVTAFLACIKNVEVLTAESLKPFLQDGAKELNLPHGKNALGTKLRAIYEQLSQNPNKTLSKENVNTLAEIKNDLLVSGQGSLSKQDSFMAAAIAKFKEKNGSSSMGVKSTWEMIIDPKTTKDDKAALQARNKAFMLETGQHEVQEWNTGSPGYKLYSDTLPNLVTRGGQTEKYFMSMFGLTKLEVATLVTMQAKFNAT
jgi:hypothetical protein